MRISKMNTLLLGFLLFFSTLALLLFMSCDKQKSKPIQLKEPRVYTNADIVTSSLLDKNGNLWFATTTEGLYKYDGRTFTNFNEEKGLCSNQIWDLLEDDKGLIWLATNKGLCNYDGKSFTHIPLPYMDTSSDWYNSVYPTV